MKQYKGIVHDTYFKTNISQELTHLTSNCMGFYKTQNVHNDHRMGFYKTQNVHNDHRMGFYKTQNQEWTLVLVIGPILNYICIHKYIENVGLRTLDPITLCNWF
jgi:hypothetical protein